MHAANLLSTRAHLTPDREALLYQATGERYTYAKLNQRANRAAHFFGSLGVEKGDRVSILAHNSLPYLDLFYGLGKIGAIFTPLNWRLAAAELSYIVNDCQPKVLLCGPEFVDVLSHMRPQIEVPHIASLEAARIEGALSYERGLEAASAEEPQRPALHADDTYCILYTSGTTGRPKGALIPHRQVLWNPINTVISWGLTETDVSPVFTPLFHAGGLFAFLTPILYAGGRIVLARTFDLEETLRALVQEKCTVILGVPTIFNMWMKAPGFAEADFRHVRFFISGGAPLDITMVKRWLAQKGGVFRQGYGLTEVGANCFSMTDQESVRKIGSVGKPIFHSKMRLVDPETGRDVLVGETGELWISGPHVCTGYWQNPEASAQALVPSDDSAWPWAWFRTGDMARKDQDGFYRIAGRFKDMIISGGENIYAAEVEAVFKEHGAVSDAALIGVPDEQWGEAGLMAVVLEPGQKASEEDLKVFCADRLARYKVPKQVVFVDSLPYSSYGKVLKPVLKEQLAK